MIPLGYYLWVDVKDKCYAYKPQTIDVLKDNIRKAIAEKQMHTIDNVLKNWTDHVQLRQPFDWNYFSLLIGRIVLSNNKRNLRKYSVVFFNIFKKKNYLPDSVVAAHKPLPSISPLSIAFDYNNSCFKVSIDKLIEPTSGFILNPTI